MEKTEFIRLHEKNMRIALAQAAEAAQEGEVPVGAAVVRGGRVIAMGRNRRERQPDPTAHAEIIAMRAAARYLGTWRLDGCALYVTLEPCPMCAGAIAMARLPMVVFGAFDTAMGCAGSAMAVIQRFSPKTAVCGGVLEEKCAGLLSAFFKEQREKEGSCCSPN